MQEVSLVQLKQLGPQLAQYLVPLGLTRKKVLSGQAHCPAIAVEGVARATQLVQTVADLQIRHPLEQGTQLLLRSG